MAKRSHPYDPRRALRLELTELISLRAWGMLSNEAAARLDELVTSGQEACRLYFDLLVETAAIGRQAGMHRVAQQFPVEEQPAPTVNNFPVEAAIFRSGDEPLAELASVQHAIPRARQRYISAKWISLAAAVAVTCWLAMAVWLFPRWTPETDTVADGDQQSIGQFTGSADSVWSEARRPALGDSLAAGPLKLDSGIAELQLSSGVRLVVSGPAELELIDASLARLDVGTLAVKVPKSAIGYTVTTRSARIVDLGTEFGVVADANGKTEVQVFEGNISLHLKLSPASASSPAMILSAGDSNCIEPDATTGKYAATRIVEPTTKIARELPESPAVSRPVYPDGLVAYWNFDEAKGPVWDERSKNHGTLEGAKRVPGLVGAGAIQFSNEPGQLVRVRSFTADLEFIDAVTIEAVFVSDWSAKLGDYDELFRKEDGNRLLLSFQHDDQHQYSHPPVPAGPVLAFGLTLAGVYQELDMPLDGQQGRPSVADLSDGKPHHVAAVYSAKSGEKAIFIDGKYCYGTQYPPGSKLASGGSQPAYIGSLSTLETFTGTLDELAIYRSALSPEEIARHGRQVQAKRSYFETTSPLQNGDTNVRKP